MGVDVGIGGRIVAHGVDAVEDAGELPAAFPENGVQLVGEPGIQNLLSVGGADGGDPVGALDGALHQVHVTG